MSLKSDWRKEKLLIEYIQNKNLSLYDVKIMLLDRDVLVDQKLYILKNMCNKLNWDFIELVGSPFKPCTCTQLKKYMSSNNISYKDISDYLGLSPSKIYNIVNYSDRFNNLKPSIFLPLFDYLNSDNY